MDFLSFITHWLGKTTNIDGVAGVQCVDLIKQYLYDCFNFAVRPMGDALQWWTNTNKELLKIFDRIDSKAPRAGDIVVLYGLNNPRVNHIVICTQNAVGGFFEALEQNGHNSGEDVQPGDEVRKRLIPVSRIAGLLRPKSYINPSTIEYYIIKKGDTFWDLERAWGLKSGTLSHLNPTLNPRTLQIGQRIRKS